MMHHRSDRFTLFAALLLASGCGSSVVNGGQGPGASGGGDGGSGEACAAASDCASPACDGEPLDCGEPPVPACISATTLRVQSAAGTCAAGACSHGQTDTEYPAGCSTAPRPASLSAGSYHTCAVDSGGALRCWGSDGWQALGDNGANGSQNAVPTTVTDLSSGVVAVAAGDGRTCAVTTSGSLLCWGVKLGTQDDPGTVWKPKIVPGLSPGVVAVTTNGVWCALTLAGALECWGANDKGELGNGTTTNSEVPVSVTGLSSGVVAGAAGAAHACALTVTGAVKCWGHNDLGQLGNGTTTDSPAPLDVPGLPSGVVALSASHGHTCALTAAGAVTCWGFILEKPDQSGATKSSTSPVAVTGLPSGVVAISAGHAHACALTAGGAVVCWGYNGLGQLGNGTTDDSWVPVGVAGLASGVVAISAGGRHTCARLATGALRCWGDNTYGQLGNPGGSSLVPVDVMGF
jgi:alpha-tubulin suppressor-like RCC1 family protein